MLRFILGRTKSGKTTEITRRICEDVKSGKKPVLIVAEQFSFESERMLLKSLGDKLSKNVSVVSFTRLCDEIEREKGGGCGRLLEDCDKVILINRALKASENELVLWKKYVNSSSFAMSLLGAVSEFKLNAISAEDLRRAAENTENGTLKNKLSDVSTVYENYELLLSERFIDPDNRLDRLYDALGESKYFDSRPVYINSFVGFTGQQYKIIERILVLAPSVTVALCDDITDGRETSLFSNIKVCKNKLIGIAKKHNIGIGDEVFLSESHYANSEMANVEKLMFGEKYEVGEDTCENVTVCKAETVYDEVRFAVRNIRRIVRENKDARYGDFVVIARDIDRYEEAFYAVCKENKVNCFIDRRMPLIAMPPAVAALSAVDLTLGLTSEKIFRFLKSGIGILSFEEIAVLENYVFVWNIKGKEWANEWTRSASGLVRAEDDYDKHSDEKLERINALRKKAIAPIQRFIGDFGSGALENSAAIVKLFESCKAAPSFKALAEEYREDAPEFYEALSQAWSLLMHTLDGLCVCFGEAAVKPKEYYNALKMSLNYASIGITPQMADEVTFGAADRIRPKSPKYCFILGANQGVFPRSVSKGGIFNFAERKALIDNNIDISDNTISAAIDEEYLVYSCVCCASDKLFISYASSIGGAKAEPSGFVKQIEKRGGKRVVEPDRLSVENLPETGAAAFSEYCKRKSLSPTESNTLIESLSGSEYEKKSEKIEEGLAKTDVKISASAAEKLYGKDVKLSPSKIECFEGCRFAYFLKYGIGANELQSADFNALQRGTIAHFVMQNMIDTYGKGLENLDDTEIAERVSEFCEDYVAGVKGYRDCKDAYLDYLLSTLKDALTQVVSNLRDEFSQSDFEPKKCELVIGNEGELAPINLSLDDEHSVTLTGKIDRIDGWNGYVRIVDYKSSQKVLNLPDILIGKNLQMLLYLYVVCGDEALGGKPAGVFYQSLARYKKDDASKRKLNGIALFDQTVRTAMERDNSGRFMQKITQKGENAKFIEAQDFETVFSYVEKRLKTAAETILSGDIEPKPIGYAGDKTCEYCDYRRVCRNEEKKPDSIPKYKKPEVLEIMAKEVADDGV